MIAPVEVEMVRQALAEVVAVDLRRVRPSPRANALRMPNGVSEHWSRRARRLTRWRLSGPEFPVVCDRHDVRSDHAEWERCGRVRVVDALRGVRCEAEKLGGAS